MSAPDDIWPERALLQGNALFSGECRFVMGVAKVEQLPLSTLPELAFAGRSNVGKSSLINALTGRKNLVKTSNTPGHTRQVNFFNLRDQLMLVDLPGYGYARASKKDIKGWNQLIFDYLRGRVPLNRVCLLIDSRHGLKPNDEEMMSFLDDMAVPYQLVLTKCDKIKKEEAESRVADIRAILRNHAAALETLAITSAAKGYGIQELRAQLAQAAS